MAIAGLGVAGDSWSDEYAGEAYNYAQNWAELLRSEKGVDLGAPGTFADDRRTGTAFNWASTGSATFPASLASGVDSLNLLIQAQDINIVDQFTTTGDVSHAVLMIGNSDFALNSEAYTNIYSGTWTQAEIDNHVIFVSTNIEAAIATLATVPMKALVTTIPDPGVTPQGKTAAASGDPAKRALVTSVINQVNTRIKESAAKYHIPVVDIAALSTTLLGTNAAPVSTRTIGGRVFDVAAGTAKTNLFVQGGELPHTVYQAYIANAIIEGLNFAYNENIPKFTEQQIVTLAGQTYAGTDTFPVNYRSLITVPPVTVFLDYGQTSTPSDDFTARISELATARGIGQLTAGELASLKSVIASKLQTAFNGFTINFSGTRPQDTRYETIKLGRLSASVPGPLTSPLGQSTFDWLNSSEISTGFIFPDLITTGFHNLNLATLPRADQLAYLQNVLSFYVAQEVGRGMGLSAADAYAYQQITSANAANTGGVQFQSFMSGDPALGFNPNVFTTTQAFSFSPLAKAKLQMGHWLHASSLVGTAETAAAHDAIGTAQALSLASSASGNLKVANVQGANIAVGSQKDLYRITAAAGDLITAQTFNTGVYPGAIDTVLKVFAADGTTLLAQSDDTLLGNNSIGQTGTTSVDNDSLILNFVAPTAGNYYIEVTAKSSATGTYDLLVANTSASTFPWQNPNNPLDVNNSAATNPVNPITAFDALAIINELNLRAISDPVTFILPAPGGPGGPPPYYDVNPDNKCTAFDALQIINFLNLNPIGGPEFVPNDMSAGEAVEESVSRDNGNDSAAATATVSRSFGPEQTARTNNSLLESRYSHAADSLTLLLLQSDVNQSAREGEMEVCFAGTEHEAALEEILNGSDE
jgi:hypothetical protein